MWTAILLGYPFPEPDAFSANVAPTWGVPASAQLQFLEPFGKRGTAVGQFSVRGGPARYDSRPAYIAVPLHFQLDGGWRFESRGWLRLRWEGGGGLHFALLGFSPHLWDTWLGWGLGVYMAPSLSFGNGPVRPVVSLYMCGTLIPTSFSGGYALNSSAPGSTSISTTDAAWDWFPTTGSASLLVGIEWGRPATPPPPVSPAPTPASAAAPP